MMTRNPRLAAQRREPSNEKEPRRCLGSSFACGLHRAADDLVRPRPFSILVGADDLAAVARGKGLINANEHVGGVSVTAAGIARQSGGVAV